MIITEKKTLITFHINLCKAVTWLLRLLPLPVVAGTPQNHLTQLGMSSNKTEDIEIKEEQIVFFSQVKSESEYLTQPIKEEPSEFDCSESIKLEQKSVKNENKLLPFVFLPVKSELEYMEENDALCSNKVNQKERKEKKKSN
ncbi:hypothetical protein C0J52_04045 [Blattella germanica]|nr:hypothetical protein C0J52_04045 [Blattella germanica]